MLPEPEMPAYTSVASRATALMLPDPDMLYFAASVMPSRVMLPDPEMLAEQVLLSICLSLTSPEP